MNSMNNLACAAADRLIIRRLVEADLWPEELSRPLGDLSGDLLPLLVASWRQAASGRRASRAAAARRRRDQLERSVSMGQRLTVRGLEPHHRWARWLGPRLVWDSGVMSEPLVGLLASRLGRRLEQRPEFFHALRASCHAARRAGERLLCVTGATPARYLELCAKRLGARILHCRLNAAHESFGVWRRRLNRHGSDEGTRVISPPLLSGENSADAVPLQERATAAMAARIDVLHLRRGGAVHQLLPRLLAESRKPRVRVARPAGPGPNWMRALFSGGAREWKIPLARRPGVRAAAPPPFGECLRCERQTGRRREFKRFLSREYLVHCTRDCPGAWPGQSQADYLAELIFEAATTRDALACLWRMLTNERILGSAHAIRGGGSVVCLAEIPIAGLRAMRRYRTHRTRWDFEPFGVCLRRARLISMGAAPVVYGDESTWRGLSRQRRPWFQQRRGRGGADWSYEREWRVLGDIDLREFADDEVLVFTSNAAEAARLQAVSRFAVAALESLESVL